MVEIHLDLDNVATRYAAELVFMRWLGLPVQWKHVPTQDVVVSVEGATAVDAVRFGGVAEPSASLAMDVLAGLAADPTRLSVGDDHLSTPDDWLDNGALSTIFHVVSGADEVGSTVRDIHGRFPSTASSLNRLGLLEVPVADVLAEYLFERLRTRWPSLPRPAKRSMIVPTHDVDVPFKHAFQSPAALLRSIVGDVVRRRQGMSSVARTVGNWRRVRRGCVETDPFNCFDRIMASSEARNLQSLFYFIAGHTAGRIDGDYQIDHPLIRDLIRRISDRGHLIGLHPSYHATMQPERLSSERDCLQRVCEQVGSKRVVDLVRTHYLRFDPASTPALLDRTGFREDSSLAFADAPGFRRGTCRSFPLWDWSVGRPLSIIERPLIAMEVSLLARRYGGHSHDEVASRLARLRSSCARFGGDFVLLWHNSSFETDADYRVYEQAIQPLG